MTRPPRTAPGKTPAGNTPRPRKAARNERIKLTATFLNGIGVACFAVGGLAPTIAMGNGSLHGGLAVYAIMAGCITGGLCLHFLARYVLGSLTD